MKKLTQIFLWLHRWTGIVFALVFIVVGLSGTLLTFRFEIQQLMHPELLEAHGVAAESIDYAQLTSAIMEQRPGAKVRFLQSNPAQADFPVRAVIDDPESGFEVIYIAPDDARIVRANEIDEGFWRWMRELHIFLVQGEPGLLIVFASGWVLMLCSLLGLWLWAPRLKKPAIALGVRWRAPLKKVLLDLHNTTGVYLLVPMLLLGLTGVTLILARISPSDLPEPPASVGGSDLSPSYDPQVALTAVLDRVRAGQARPVIRQIQMPSDRLPHFAVDLEVPGVGYRKLYLDTTGRPITGYDESQLGLWDRLKGQFGTAIHEGYVLGDPGRWIVFLCGLTLTIGSVTGVWLWLVKRSPRRLGRKPQKAPIKPINQPAE